MRSLVVLAALAGAASLANAAPAMTVQGTVTAAASRWTADHSRIVTEATVRTTTGDVLVSQLGGTADGLSMRTMPGPELLVLGMQVTLAAHHDIDLAQRDHVVIDGVKVDAYPPDFVRTGPTKAGHSLYWESGCILVTEDSAGTKEIAGTDEFPIIDASIATWNDDTHTSTCSYMKVVSNGTAAVEVGNDNVNVIKFRDASWCRPAIKDDPARCYLDSAAGITTAVYVDDSTSSRDGAIVDADVELNGVNFAISVGGVSLGVAACKAELQNTLTHELGHLHGLEHTCLTGNDPPRVDDQGAAVPQCSATTDPKITEATMYPFQDCGETKKETLEPDDTNAICTIYPIANDPKSCSPVGSGGGCCSAQSSGGPAGVSALALALLVGLALQRTKNRRRA